MEEKRDGEKIKENIEKIGLLILDTLLFLINIYLL